MTDAAAALVDAPGRPPRQGDGDDGAALRSTARRGQPDPWSSLLALGRTAFGSAVVVAARRADRVQHAARVRSSRAARLIPNRPPGASARLLATRASCCCAPARRVDARDLVPLRLGTRTVFYATAAHAHADALVDRGAARRRRHPRRSGNVLLPRRAGVAFVLPLDRRAQHRRARGARPVALGRSVPVGPSGIERISSGRDTPTAGEIVAWSAEHDGYETLSPPAVHRRAVRLDQEQRALTIVDTSKPAESTRSRCIPPRSRRGSRARRSVARLHWIVPATGIGLDPRRAHAPRRTALECAPRRDRSGPRLVLVRVRREGTRITLEGIGTCAGAVASRSGRRSTSDEHPSAFARRRSTPDVADNIQHDA